jgi:hypothetical protein
MLKKLLLKTTIVLAVFALFSVVFDLLQQPIVYNSTLGRISDNYERVGNIQRYTINKVNKPFNDVTESNAYNWDAAHYLKIRDSLYNGIDPHYADRYAFYPFFPMIWKISGIRSHHISFVNYLLFGLSLIILSQLFMKDKPTDMFFFILALLIPSAIVFYLPYAESLFVLTLAIAMYGLFKRKYWIYFIAMLCFSMTRPAVVILIFAFIGTDVIYFFKHRSFKHFVKQSVVTIAPVIIGCFVVTAIQYYYSDSWTAYFDTSEFWTKESGFFNKITDWSTEGFGMTSFSIFFLALPALIYSIVLAVSAMVKKNDKNTVSLFAGDESYIKEYIFNVSMLFITGVLLYFAITSGNVLNGFFRYTMAIPFFYIVFFQLPEKLENIKLGYKIVGSMLSLILLFWFLTEVHYTGNLLRFEYTGLYLFVFIASVVIFEKYLPRKVKYAALLLYIIPAIVWHTYLFNMYLSNAWIFT